MTLPPDLRPIALHIQCEEGIAREWIPAFQVSANFAASPEPRERWNLSHIGTGRRVAILGSLERVREAAAELEAIADFSFADEEAHKSHQAQNPAAVALVRRLREEMDEIERERYMEDNAVLDAYADAEERGAPKMTKTLKALIAVASIAAVLYLLLSLILFQKYHAERVLARMDKQTEILEQIADAVAKYQLIYCLEKPLAIPEPQK